MTIKNNIPPTAINNKKIELTSKKVVINAKNTKIIARKIPEGILKKAAKEDNVIREIAINISLLPEKVLTNKHLKFKGSINVSHVISLFP